jgi:hypothetical protein
VLSALRGRAADLAVFEVTAALPRFGEGARLRRVTWRRGEGEPDCFWTVGTVKPRAVRRSAQSRSAAAAARRAASQP